MQKEILGARISKIGCEDFAMGCNATRIGTLEPLQWLVRCDCYVVLPY